jgi:large repetitive protein
MRFPRLTLTLFLLVAITALQAQVSNSQRSVQASPLAVVVSASVNDVSCSNVCDGVITATANPAGVYQYAIDNFPFQSSNVFSNLCPGVYRISVRNLAGDNDTAMVSVGILPPSVSQFSTQAPTCISLCGGILEVSQTTPPGLYQFSLNNGPYQTDSVFAGLCSGMYALTVQRVPGCTVTDTVFIDPAPVFTVQYIADSVSCPESCDGSIQALPSLPGSYQYQLNNSATQTLPVFANLCQGIYAVTVSGQPGCIVYDTVSIAAPPVVSVSATIVPPTCHNDCDAELTVFASLPGNYEYSIDSGLTYQPFNQFTALCSGVYPVQIKNDNGCVFYLQQTIPNPPPPSINIQPVNPLCANSCSGSVNIVAPGAVQYLVDSVVQAQSTFYNLCAGSYTVSIVDSIGCSAAGSFLLTDPLPLLLQTSAQMATCNNCNGVITYAAAGGTQGYSFVISGNNGPVSGVNLCPGTYIVQVSDTNNCIETDTLALNAIPAISIDSAVVINDIDSSSTGTVALFVSGSAPVSFTWNPAVSVTSLASGLLPGVYCVVVTDSAGCTDSVCVTVSNIISGVNTQTAQPGITVFPNPFVDHLVVSGALPHTRFTISDATGRVLLEDRLPVAGNIIVPASFSSGSYLLTLYSDEKVWNVPLMKVR